MLNDWLRLNAWIIKLRKKHLQNTLERFWPYLSDLNLVLLNQDIPCLCKQCRSRSAGFFRSQLDWICTVCQLESEFVTTTWIKESDWLKIKSGRGILIYSAWIGLRTFLSDIISIFWSKNYIDLLSNLIHLVEFPSALLESQILWILFAFMHNKSFLKRGIL